VEGAAKVGARVRQSTDIGRYLMAHEPQSPLKDRNYNLVSVLEASLKMAWQLHEFIEDAESAGDTELADWFRRVQENDLKAGEQAKRMLAQRLQNDAD
jgi:hypothetical protein